MSLFMETTKIEVGVTVAEIQRILGRYGANAIMTEYKDGEVVGMSFRVALGDKQVPFVMPCRWEPIYKVLVRHRRRTTRADEERVREQAKRVAWRQILRWIEAQMALVVTEMVTLQEVFLPYVQTGIDETLYQRLQKTKFQGIEFKGGE